MGKHLYPTDPEREETAHQQLVTALCGAKCFTHQTAATIENEPEVCDACRAVLDRTEAVS